MNVQNPSSGPCNWKQSFLFLFLAVACFQGAYASVKFPIAGLLIIGYAYGLIRLADQPTVRRAFYFGLATGILCAAPQLFFFWTIFGPPAIILWIVLAFWIGLFAATSCGAIRRWGKAKAMWLIPFIWTGIEYFRSEWYYLKFSWLNIGYALPSDFQIAGMYGIGFLIFAVLVAWMGRNRKALVAILGIAILFSIVTRFQRSAQHLAPLSIAGIEMEFPPAKVLPEALAATLRRNPQTQIFVLSEDTLDGPPPDSLKEWCRKNSRYLIVGGKDAVTNQLYYNTAFVIGTNGDVVFKQAKSVPLQFFDDGLPAAGQEVWNSPWGKIGVCICYDLSYTRVTDPLVRKGAQLLIVPTMDVAEWGRHEHELHSRVAPVRAAEYGIPIFRLASSGISQAVDGSGTIVAHSYFDRIEGILCAKLQLPGHGSLPLDRFLAPLCTGVTAIVLAVLLWLAWKDHRAIHPPPTTKSS